MPSRRESKREREWLDGLTDGQLLCRDTGVRHAWEPAGASKEDYGFSRSLVCTRCKAIKTQKLDRNGYLISNSSRVSYEAGYLRPSGSGFASKEDNARIRKANMQRATRNLRVV